MKHKVTDVRNYNFTEKDGFTLITNDSDFKTQEIPVLTANNALLTN